MTRKELRVNFTAYQIMDICKEKLNVSKDIIIGDQSKHYTTGNNIICIEDEVIITIFADSNWENIKQTEINNGSTLSECISIRNRLYKDIFNSMELSTNYTKHEISRLIRSAEFSGKKGGYIEFTLILDKSRVKNNWRQQLDYTNLINSLYEFRNKNVMDISTKLDMDVSSVSKRISKYKLKKQKMGWS
mgnify:CR=1 FL=1